MNSIDVCVNEKVFLFMEDYVMEHGAGYDFEDILEEENDEVYQNFIVNAFLSLLVYGRIVTSTPT